MHCGVCRKLILYRCLARQSCPFKLMSLQITCLICVSLILSLMFSYSLFSKSCCSFCLWWHMNVCLSLLAVTVCCSKGILIIQLAGCGSAPSSHSVPGNFRDGAHRHIRAAARLTSADTATPKSSDQSVCVCYWSRMRYSPGN